MDADSLRANLTINQFTDPELFQYLITKPVRKRASILVTLATRGLVAMTTGNSQGLVPSVSQQAVETPATLEETLQVEVAQPAAELLPEIELDNFTSFTPTPPEQ